MITTDVQVSQRPVSLADNTHKVLVFFPFLLLLPFFAEPSKASTDFESPASLDHARAALFIFAIAQPPACPAKITNGAERQTGYDVVRVDEGGNHWRGQAGKFR